MIESSLRVGVCVAACCLAGVCQTPPAFEVASVKVAADTAVAQPSVLKCENGRLTIRNSSFLSMVSWAYDVIEPDMAPVEWMRSRGAPKYDIDATANGPAEQSQVKLMLRRLLAERFQFAGHHEMREGVYRVLRVGKAGPKLTEAADSKVAMPIRSDPANLRIICRGATIADFLFRLWVMGSGRIYDETGLNGRYDFTLDYANYLDPDAPKSLNALTDARFAAMRPQLGLEVVEAKTRVDIFVVDHAEKTPIEN